MANEEHVAKYTHVSLNEEYIREENCNLILEKTPNKSNGFNRRKWLSKSTWRNIRTFFPIKNKLRAEWWIWISDNRTLKSNGFNKGTWLPKSTWRDISTFFSITNKLKAENWIFDQENQPKKKNGINRRTLLTKSTWRNIHSFRWMRYQLEQKIEFGS